MVFCYIFCSIRAFNLLVLYILNCPRFSLVHSINVTTTENKPEITKAAGNHRSGPSSPEPYGYHNGDQFVTYAVNLR
ncbi:hypothetical protein HanXRQr2_Chr06g0252371 [Helianthus annuus]|uniref:Secreted protein n=1 Tax=Helianthus annuus TaxID=4232 RepID=A0A9K3ISF2_HELAN|nr:hypothetical protein HanXRQr2_Chr06g0252371 [Helianthus annuus]